MSAETHVPFRAFELSGIWIRADDRLPSVESHPDFAASQKFRKNYHVDATLDLDWVQDLVETRYQLIDQKLKTMDEKADAIFRYLGGGTAVVAAAGLASGSAAGGFLPWLLMPAAICATVAIWHAIIARRPSGQGFMRGADEALRLAHKYRDGAKSLFLVEWEMAGQVSLQALSIKSAAVDAAMCWYYRAIVCLLFPLILAPIIPTKPAATPVCRCSELTKG